MQTTDAVRNDADVVVVVGARLGEYDGWGMPPAWGDPERQRTIQIDCDPMSIGLNRPVDLPIVADAGAALSALLGAVQAAASARTDAGRRRALRRAARGDRRQRRAGYVLAEASHGRQPGADGDGGTRGLPPRRDHRGRRGQHHAVGRGPQPDLRARLVPLLGEDGLPRHRPALRHRRPAGRPRPARCT